MDATQAQELINNKVIITLKNGDTREGFLVQVKVNKSDNTVRGIVWNAYHLAGSKIANIEKLTA